MADEDEQPSSEPEQQNETEAQLAEMRDRMLRALAEAENIRRRAEREKLEVSQYAIARFARDMLQIADNFGRALAACPKDLREAADPQVKAVIDGVDATERQLLATLERYGVKIIDTVDAKFDPKFHQAIAEVPGEGKPARHDRECGADRLHDRRTAVAPRHGHRGAQGRRPVGGVDTKA